VTAHDVGSSLELADDRTPKPITHCPHAAGFSDVPCRDHFYGADRPAQLERTADATEPDREGVAMSLIFRQALIAVAVAVVVAAIADFIKWETGESESEPRYIEMVR
jgi:hypothetical protein